MWTSMKRMSWELKCSGSFRDDLALVKLRIAELWEPTNMEVVVREDSCAGDIAGCASSAWELCTACGGTMELLYNSRLLPHYTVRRVKNCQAGFGQVYGLCCGSGTRQLVEVEVSDLPAELVVARYEDARKHGPSRNVRAEDKIGVAYPRAS
ncbi:unnamed protein product [Phytophthora fragariaefolia]|uniref:Unnamed protein product n=1 Tax=Phytophthora fragariaefolia TaxID=1490495 RepID=A0A9W6U3K8_9STRA|nr:unnamed protein product [Phytophthora fragariaefolia]